MDQPLRFNYLIESAQSASRLSPTSFAASFLERAHDRGLLQSVRATQNRWYPDGFSSLTARCAVRAAYPSLTFPADDGASMTDRMAGLHEALGDKYRIERELGAGGMASRFLSALSARRRHLAAPSTSPAGMRKRSLCSATCTKHEAIEQRPPSSIGGTSRYSRTPIPR